MGVVPADAFITLRVTSEIKAHVRALANRQGITESRLLKDLLEAALHTGGFALAPLPPRHTVNRSARISLRLNPEDWELLRQRAETRKIPSATYVALLLRSHLRGAAPLPKEEYLALRRCVLEVAAVGRNLNQIARAINQGETLSLAGLPDVDALIKVAVQLRDHVKALLIANERSWLHAPALTTH
jgi:predicted DNA binding CopG/RHH family protein